MIVGKSALEDKKLYLKDPTTTELGDKIISNSIKIIDEIGFDNFNFKKLAIAINSTEASVYRYFENKHKLLFYLISWYWSWIKTTLEYKLYNINSPKEKLKISIKAICNSHFDDPETKNINEEALSRIVIAEAVKSYTTKHVKEDYKAGLFEAYKVVCSKLEEIIRELNPNYKYPKALAVGVIRLIHKQIFFAQQLPELTDLSVINEDTSEIEEFICTIIFATLKVKNN
ncbi:MAG: TetR/AcrR family transcriptional regulator [Candidatus Sericytochromatia bacterium]